jgi:NAD(P)-dependent dehydrogenase (short-subunit alcohol dehydrogenase family)
VTRYSLNGKRALVTGGARGIGRGIVLALVEAGARVTIADRDADAADVAARDLCDGVAIAVEMDVADRASVESGFDLAEHAFGPVDIVAANAGILKFAPFLELSTADWQQHIDVDFTGVFHTAQAAAQRMVLRGRPGSVIVVRQSPRKFRRARRATTARRKLVPLCSFARWRGSLPTAAFASTRSARAGSIRASARGISTCPNVAPK